MRNYEIASLRSVVIARPAKQAVAISSVRFEIASSLRSSQ